MAVSDTVSLCFKNEGLSLSLLLLRLRLRARNKKYTMAWMRRRRGERGNPNNQKKE
jgi:hypothetical protein